MALPLLVIGKIAKNAGSVLTTAARVAWGVTKMAFKTAKKVVTTSSKIVKTGFKAADAAIKTISLSAGLYSAAKKNPQAYRDFTGEELPNTKLANKVTVVPSGKPQPYTNQLEALEKRVAALENEKEVNPTLSFREKTSTEPASECRYDSKLKASHLFIKEQHNQL